MDGWGAQLVRDAQRHGVEVKPVDVIVSDWDCTLEKGTLRLGLRMVRGLSEAGARRIVASRPFESMNELARRAALDRRDLGCLAAAGALASLAGHRRQAHWRAAGVEPAHEMLRAAPVRETAARARTVA